MNKKIILAIFMVIIGGYLMMNRVLGNPTTSPYHLDFAVMDKLVYMVIDPVVDFNDNYGGDTYFIER